jgi:hypothetical protein
MKKKILFLAALFATGVITSCKKDFLSLEVNPNTPSVTTPQFALSGAEKIAADIVNTSYNVYGVWGGFWTPSGNYVPSPALQQYQFTTNDFQVFTTLFQNATNFDNLEKIASADGTLANFQAIAKIMKAYDFEQLVDVYNDVPYTQAFNASQYLFPKYDSGKDIYDDLAKQLVAAIGIINANPSAINPLSSDIVFGGDMTKWKKFANTLLLRLAIRQSKLDGGTAKALLGPLVATGYIDDTFYAKANPGYTGSGVAGQQSPFWRVYGTDLSGNQTGNNLYYRANQFAVDLLNGYTDPRVSRFYAPIPSGLEGKPGTVKGIILGDPNAAANAGTSAIGPGLLKATTMDANLLSSSESLFLQAEAVLRTWIPGNAQTLYEAGVKASFVQTGAVLLKTPYEAAIPEDKTTTPVKPAVPAVPATYYTVQESYDIYIAQNVKNTSWAASTNKYEAVSTQKWISLNGYANLEAFSEYKRTGFPLGLTRSIDTKAIGSGIPNRIYFPASEYQQNADAVGAVGTVDPFTTKIFWMP